MDMDQKPLLFPFLYEIQEGTELMSESTSIYDVPVLREKSKGVQKAVDNQVAESAKKPPEKIRSIALKNRKIVQGTILRNEFAKLLVETKDGPVWIAKSQIVQIYDV